MKISAVSPLEQRYVRLLLCCRWLVVGITPLLIVLLEVSEGRGLDLESSIELLIYGLAIPSLIWILLTALAWSLAERLQLVAALEYRQRLVGPLTELYDFAPLATSVVECPAEILPVRRVALYLYDHRQSQAEFVTQWSSLAGVNDQAALDMRAFTVCQSCLQADRCALHPTHQCGCTPRSSDYPDADEYCLPLVHDRLLVGVLRLWGRAGRKVTAEQIGTMNAVSTEIALALALSIAHSQQVNQMRWEAQSAERRRITHVLHDSLAQEVSYLHFGLDQMIADEAIARHDPARRKLEHMRTVALDVYEQIRHNLLTLRSWEQTDLNQAVIGLVREVAASTDLGIHVTTDGRPTVFSAYVSQQIFNLVCEGLNNVRKHARAQRVVIRLVWSNLTLTIQLHDDGVGFNPALASNADHLGLRMMREEVERLHGQFIIDSHPGKGTRLYFEIPLWAYSAD